MVAVPERFDLYALRRQLDTASAVGIHFQLAKQEDSSVHVAAIAVAWPKSDDSPLGATWVFHATSTFSSLWRDLLDSVLTAPNVTKSMLGVHEAAHALHDGKPYTLNSAIDLQLYFEHVVDTRIRDATLPRIVNQLDVNTTLDAYKDALTESKPSRYVEGSSWRPGQFPHELAKSMAAKAQAYLACLEQGLLNKTSRIARQQLQVMTSRRWAYAAREESGGRPKIWFDTEHDFTPRSLECLGSEDAVANAIPMLDLQCEIDSLLALLPSRYREVILSIDGYATKLVDVCLDVGRLPHAYIGRSQRVVLDTQRNGSPLSFSRLTKLLTVSDNGSQDSPGAVTVNEIKSVLDQLGGELKIGNDNRAGIDRQLHRISVMRSKTDQIYGLTLRVGRTLYFASNYLLDLLMSSEHRAKSILLLGRPGSGKTTLIRDIARCISESGVNVCIIDTSNEIGGDGLVPHGCVGWSRRMMVKSLGEQASVMVECVQNHTVETLIVDEIGRKAEVNAASTVRQRGPRIIASAHGDFRSLIKNKDLNGLIGGVQSVTVGDSEARKNSHLGKVQAKRGGNPIFDVVVEIDEVERGKCRIVWDVGQAVDDVLSGDTAFLSETRFQSFGMRGVQVVG